MDKIKTIENIDNVAEFSRSIEDLLRKMQLDDVVRLGPSVLKASEKSSLGKRFHAFICSVQMLAGKNNEILEQVKSYAYNLDSVYIISASRKVSNYFKGWLEGELPNVSFSYWDVNDVVTRIDEHMPEYWSYDEFFIRPYEIYFKEKIKNDFELRTLLRLDEKYNKLLDIFIEPKLSSFVPEKETGRLVKKAIDKNVIIKGGSYVICGDAGTGKTTLLKEIGRAIIEARKESNKEITYLPIFIKTGDILQCNFDLKNVIEKTFLNCYQQFDIDNRLLEYGLVLLFDTLDEFEKDRQKHIISQIEDLEKTWQVRYVICTRSYEYLTKDCPFNKHSRVNLENFNVRQIKNFVTSFFRFDSVVGDKLIRSLEDNNILDKLPITPLTLSVISILYEERQYEIPATITDVYDNFNLFLLGRTTVKSNLEFLDISIKERVLSIYALDIINNDNRQKKTKDEFIQYIADFFRSRAITINENLVPELVNSLTQGTGVLVVDENERVCFIHDYFMEYYASLEIFKQRRDLENTLIDRFVDFNWQNTSIFYAGRTKDMPSFLERLIEKVKNLSNLNECLIAVSGMGYILQALWLTDSQKRKEGIIESLNLLIKADQRVKELAAQKFPFFASIKDPDIALMNLFWFYRHFCSITLKDSLSFAFDELYSKVNTMDNSYFESDRRTLLYQLFCVALTLSSNRINNADPLKLLFEEKGILSNPLFLMLFDVGVDIINPSESEKIKHDKSLESRRRKYKDGIRFYVENPAEKLRLTSWENIRPYSNVELYTEGKTDAEIILHAFHVLSNGKFPYWNIRACNTMKGQGGGATELAKFITSLAPKIDNDSDREKFVIGIFDNDAKGIQEFRGLRNNIFEEVNPILKKHKEQKIYALKLPIPPSKEIYVQEKQEFNFFSIEHYFPYDFLVEKKMLKETPIPNVYEVTGEKAKFASVVSKIWDISIFEEFRYLFESIDVITGQKLEYA